MADAPSLKFQEKVSTSLSGSVPVPEKLRLDLERDFQGRPVLVIGVLTGCLVFLADLIRRIDLPLRIHLIQASSYRGETTMPGKLDIHLDGLPPIAGRDVLVIDDILDTGQTLGRLAKAVGVKPDQFVATLRL